MGCRNQDGYADVRLLLVGLKRTGKSCTGNSLLAQGQAFEVRGGGTSAAASSVTAGRHVTVVDARGWSSTEEFVPREEKIELMRAFDLCGPAGPHCVLLVIPLLDFTEADRRAVERRMELFTSAVWRHTMVLFTFGDLLRARGLNVREHIQSGGPALHWLMEKCRFKYHVFDNKTSSSGRVNVEVKKCQGTLWRKDEKRAGSRRESEDAGQRQVRELLSKVEDMLLENGGWHFSLHMYRRMEEEWNRREQQLRAQLEAEIQQKLEETMIHVKTMQVERMETTEAPEGRPRKGDGEREGRDEEALRKELQRQISQEEGYDTSSESEREREEERGLMTNRGKEGMDIKSEVVQSKG